MPAWYLQRVKVMEQFIDREDPDAISFEALDEPARLQLAEVATAQVEVAGTIRGGRIMPFDRSPCDMIYLHGGAIVMQQEGRSCSSIRSCRQSCTEAHNSRT